MMITDMVVVAVIVIVLGRQVVCVCVFGEDFGGEDEEGETTTAITN